MVSDFQEPPQPFLSLSGQSLSHEQKGQTGEDVLGALEIPVSTLGTKPLELHLPNIFTFTSTSLLLGVMGFLSIYREAVWWLLAYMLEKMF